RPDLSVVSGAVCDGAAAEAIIERPPEVAATLGGGRRDPVPRFRRRREQSEQAGRLQAARAANMGRDVAATEDDIAAEVRASYDGVHRAATIPIPGASRSATQCPALPLPRQQRQPFTVARLVRCSPQVLSQRSRAAPGFGPG